MLFFFASLAFAQQPVSIHLTEKDGLPDIEFYDIAEDNEGFIWLAADKGLYRYDGREYKLFTHPQKRGRSLFYLTLDNKGRIWCNNLAGQFFYVENEKLVLFKNFEDINTFSDFNIFKNHLIVISEDEIISVNIDTKEVVGVIEKKTNAFFVDINTDSDIFYFSKGNINYYTNDVTLKDYRPLTNKRILKIKDRYSVKYFKFKNQIFSFKKEESSGKIYVSSLENNTFKNYILPEIILYSVVSHAYEINNQFWILTNKGIFVIDVLEDQFLIKNHFFKDVFVTDVLRDKNMNYWITTLKKGIYILPNPELKKIQLLDNLGVTAMDVTDNSELYFSTSKNNIYAYNLKNNQLDKTDISFNNNVYDICYNNYTKTLLFTATNESLIYDLNQNTANNISLQVTKSIKALDSSNYLVSLPYSLGIYNKAIDSTNTLVQKRSYSSTFNHDRTKVYSNFIDGLAVVNLKNKKYNQIFYNNKPIYGSKIVLDSNNILWIATHNEGLYGFKDNQIKYIFNTEKGLTSHLINAIEPDGNSIWLATDKGLQNYNYLTDAILNLDRQDGINSYNITDIKKVDDEIYFCSNTGLYKFNPQKIIKVRQAAQPYFTNVLIKEIDTVLKSSYSLKQANSEIEFQFNTSGFQTDQFIEYSYRLEGQNKNWSKVPVGSNFVKYNALPSGNYQFILKAKNRFGDTYSKPISISLKVISPFYKTIPFYIIMLLLISGLLWLFFKRETKKLKAKQRRELEKANISKSLVFTKLENLRSQMNPHFIFNALNSIQDYIILNEKDLARDYLIKFSRLIRTYLEHSQENKVSLKEEIDALQLYLELEKDRFDEHFKFKINIHNKLDLEEISVPSLFIQPYVENAIKHGLLHKEENKKLNVNFIKMKFHNN